MDFVSLHTHTTYTLTNSLIKPSELFLRVKELGQSGVGVTDTGTLAGAWDCLKYSKEAGVKLIMGCEFYFIDDVKAENPEKTRRIILLAKNHQGYKNLLLAHKLANDNFIVHHKRVVPRIDWSILEKCQEGLICLTAGGNGILGQLINTRQADKAKEQARKLKDIFGLNLGLEVQPHNMKRNITPYNDYEDQRFVNQQLIKFGQELDIKIVPTCAAHYVMPEHWEAHDALWCIGSGASVKNVGRLHYQPEQFYLRSREQVESYFTRLYADKASQFCDNTLYFADLCEKPEWIDPKFSNPSGKELPEFPVKDQEDYGEFKEWLSEQSDLIKNQKEDAAYLRYCCDKEFDNKVKNNKDLYKERLKEELEVIEHHNFSSYMLIVSDYVNFCKKNKIPVGVGRGSVCASVLAYLIGIHEVDSIKYNLIFARFHNKEKTSYPDIDGDFSQDGKIKVQQYLVKKYGEDNVAHVSNVNTLSPKPYAKSIARIMEYGGDRKTAVAIGNALAESIPDEIHTIEEAFSSAPLFDEYANSPKYSELKKFAPFIAGKASAWATHAGGVIVAKRPLTEIVPTRRSKDGDIAIEYDKDRAEANGLVKMDILGVSTLDIINNTFELIIQQGKELSFLPWDYDKNDEITYDLISKGNTNCVFQLGTSGGTIELCRKIKPKNIEDLAMINALTRPGCPKEVRADFIRVKQNGEEVKLIHPLLKRAFAPTLGFPIYEECLMFMAQDVAGWDLHQADKLRKFVKDKGKDPDKGKKLRKEFIKGAIENVHLTEDIPIKIWDEIINNFGNYAFNKSHAVAYSFLSYQTAYLKANYPLEFLTVNLTHESKANTPKTKDNILAIKGEIRKLKVKITPPDINQSETTYRIIDQNTLLTGLDSLKFIGKDAIPEILAKRPFVSFEDFLSEVDGKKVRAPSVLALAASGCLDSFGMSRKQMFLYTADYKKKLAVWNKKHAGQSFKYPFPTDTGEWNIREKYAMEMFYLGEGLSGNVYDLYPGFFDNRAVNFVKLAQKYPDLPENEKKPIFANDGVIEGVIKKYFESRIKKETSKIYGETMARMILEDPYGNSISITLFPKKLKYINQRLKELAGSKVKLEPGTALHIAGSLNWYEGDLSIIFEDLKKCMSAPPLPDDLKPRKVNMKIAGIKKKSVEIDPEEFLEEVEAELIEEGMADLEEDLVFDSVDEEIEKPDAFV